jgi:hypothetical protein
MIDTVQLESLACYLSGKPVWVRRRWPAQLGAIGTASQSKSGAYFVDLAPDLTGDKLVETFLHECAHVRLGHCRKTVFAAAPSGSITRRLLLARDVLPEAVDQERQANSLKAEWLAWLHAHDGDLESLRRWYPAEVQAMIDKAVEKAIAELPR